MASNSVRSRLVHGEQRKLQSGGNTQFVKDIAEMMFHCFLADLEVFGNFLVRVRRDDCRNDF